MISATTLIAVTVMTATVLADPTFHFAYDNDAIVPGVRSFSREARTSAPPAGDSAIFFPGGSTGGEAVTGVGAARPHGMPINTRRAGPVRPVSESALELPADIGELDVTGLARLNAISDMSDFVSLFNLSLPDVEGTAGFSVSSRFGGDSIDGVGETFEMASCKPELVTVPLDLPVEPNTMFFPTCIRLEQCGGCCFGPLLTCRPSVTKIVKVKVLKVNSAAESRQGRGRHRRRNTSSYHIVEAVKHTACECGCKVREEDCNSDLHTYFEGECSCVCKNKDEKEKCEQQNSTKYWDNDSCSCFCRKSLDCGSGEFFSQASCSCERLVARSGFLLPGREAAALNEEDPVITVSPNVKPINPRVLPDTRTRRPKPVRVPLNRNA